MWIYYCLLNRIRLGLDLDNSYWVRKILNFAANNINIWFFTNHNTYSDLGKLKLLNLIVLLTS